MRFASFTDLVYENSMDEIFSKHRGSILRAAPSDGQREGQPFFLCPVTAGWPSPAEDYMEDTLDLHEYLVRNKPATYFVRAVGDSMIGAGIHDGDMLIVDRSVEPSPGKVVIAAVEGELTVKRFIRRGKRLLLSPENPDYREIDITETEETVIWGVVTNVIHPL